jgi:predicted deacylase
MVMPTVKPIIFDGNEQRPMTADEYAQWQADNVETEAQAEAEAQAAEAKAEAKASALAKLGLTADEAAALLG